MVRSWTFVLTLVAACASASVPPPEPEPEPPPAPPVVVEEPAFACPEEAGLCFDVEPASAELVINGESKGRIEEIGQEGELFLPLEAGIYQVTLTAEGYVTWRSEVSVQKSVEKIEVSLTTQP